ncbi:MAG: serine/threonine-protein kinase, partial [Vicinamibacteria bacterium]
VLPPDRGATQDSRDRFRREARTAAKLSHPNIVPLYTFGDVDGTLYFVMGYVKGESLAARLKREGRLRVEDARRILIEIAEALDYAHKLGIVHRDIKPDNVLIEEGTERAMLMDFGVAKALGAGQTMTELGSVLGTPQYMSPEQAQGKSDIDHRSDLYSLGVMGYAMLAGRLPFEGPTPGDVMVQHITKEAPALKSIAPEVPPEIATALTRTLAKDPNQRWPDARTFKEAITLKDGDEIPEEMAELRRDTQFVGFGFYLSALIAFRSTTLLPEPDGVPIPWGVAYFFTGIMTLAWLNSMRLHRREGRSWDEILAFAFSKPSWWVGWYPRRLRLRGDVWRRLPTDLRRARAALWALIVAWVLLMPANFIYLSGTDSYRRTGLKNPGQIFFDHLPKGFGMLVVVGALAALGVVVVAFVSAGRWGRSDAVAKRSRHLTNAMFLRDTAHRTFWSKPEVSELLRPRSEDGSRGGAGPKSARDLVAAIATGVSSLGGESRTLGARAREVASDLALAIERLDREVTSLAGAADAAEVGRLAAKLAALGAPSADEGVAKGQMRDMFQKQLDLLRGFESRLEELKAKRARRLELLRRLWLQAIELPATVNDAPGTSGAADRIRTLCAEIAGQLGGISPHPQATEGISEAPTIERS